ncbi:MAG: SLBB domain-containing protein [Firmicutes bacterium]|nr:SLBB domain-containing protein [Bacillota bacterium]
MSLADKVKAAGVVGAGGAGFPTHAKYTGQVEFVLANGAECEPLLYVDQQLMENYTDEFLEGMELIVEALQAKRGIVCLKKKQKHAVEILKEKIPSHHTLDMHLLGNYYPAGDEFILVYDAINRVIPEGGLPLDVGAVVNNVMTVINVARANRGIPVTDRIVTVHGEVNKPSTFFLPVGTSFREAIELAGGTKIRDYVVISGGPMMGSIEEDLDAPITKTTSGLIVLPHDNYLVMRKREPDNTSIRRGRSTCDQCMYCTEFCPRYIIGHRLRPHKSAMRCAPYGLDDTKLLTSSWLCCECKLCDYFSCPLFLSPGKIHGIMKKEMAAAGLRNTQSREKYPEPRPFADTRRVPTQRLIHRLQLTAYKQPAPLVETGFTPSVVKIPLRQHIGAPAMPLVQPGQMVNRGELIGEIPEGKLGARVHASITGMVREVSHQIVIEKA